MLSILQGRKPGPQRVRGPTPRRTLMAVHRARGTRDFLPEQMHDRRAVVSAIAEVYERHGFEPLDTPAFERIETLQGKGGEESDKLIYKILKRGAGAEQGKCDLALRYDLTVPLARVVAMHPEIRLPFKRYHMGPVWRADRPARGRFREFWQCDVDIVGSTSTLAESEVIAALHRALCAIGFAGAVFRLNDRRLLRALATSLGVADRESELLIVIDKLGKVGVEGVNAELLKRGFSEDTLTGLWAVLDGDDAPLTRMASALAGQEGTEAAVADLQQVCEQARQLGVPADAIRIDPTLARGLDYYTGPIWEIELPGADMGSVGSGGRYDGLIGVFGKKSVPAVGGSLGLERLLVLRAESEGAVTRTAAPVLVTVFDSERAAQSLHAAAVLRQAGIGADVYADARKFSAQMKYANARGYPYVIVIGAREAESETVVLRDMVAGEEQSVSLATVVSLLSRSTVE